MAPPKAARKSVLVTGCSAGGIGPALALAFQKRGYLVFATARKTGKLPEALTSLPNVISLEVDVVSPDSVAAALEKVKSTVGENGLDVLINNSGQVMLTPGLDEDIDAAKAMYEVNYWGVLRMTQAFAGLLIQARGALVNMSSIGADTWLPWTATYAASKAALTTWSETMRLELAPLGVRVLVIITGLVKTNLFVNTVATHGVFSLPDTSYYKSLEGVLREKQGGKLVEGPGDADVFAAKVVDDVEKGGHGRRYIGNSAPLVKIAGTFFPRWLVDKMLRDMSPELNQLGK